MPQGQEVVIVDNEGVEHVFPEGFDPKRAAQIVRGAAAGWPKAPAPPPPGGGPSVVDMALADNPALPPQLRAGQALLRTAKRNPATTGAMVGGALASPFTAGMSAIPAMAAIGGASALGAGGGQLAAGEAPDLRTMATEGIGAAAGEGAGRGVVALAKKAAPIIGKAVLRASPTLQKEYPNLVETFLQERVPVSQHAEIGTRMLASANTAKQMAADAEAGGAPKVFPSEVYREFKPLREEVANRATNGSPMAPIQLQEIVDRAKALRAAGPQPVTKNQVLKQSAQADASKAFRAADRGAVVNDMTAKLDKAVAIARQKAAETRVPGIKDVNKRTQDLMGLEHAMEDASLKSATTPGLNPVNWLAALAPDTTSHAAFATDTASRLPFAATLRNALIAALGGLEDQGGR